MLEAAPRERIDIKSVLTKHVQRIILVECKRGEPLAKNTYKDALKLDFTDDIRSMVQHQYKGLLKKYERVYQLKEKYSSK
ncbi:MAG: hypothetical protein J0M23_04245 [Rickettsiales bacterium]|nr:hypothetical protein [Rickettsiales bacterium]